MTETTVATTAKELAMLCVQGLQDKKGQDITIMDLREVQGAVADYFVVCTGTSDRHVQALSDSVEKLVKEQTAEYPHNKEGRAQGEWALIDYVNVVVHVFQKEKRQFYSIEELWGDAVFEKVED